MAIKAIVIVEDDATIAEFMKEALSTENGYTVATVGDGAEALDLMAQVTTDLVILDYGLPGLSGIDVYDHLRARLDRTMPAVLFVSASLPHDELAARGVTDFLAKPFELDALLQRVATLLGD